jgi:hypothetical protein
MQGVAKNMNLDKVTVVTFDANRLNDASGLPPLPPGCDVVPDLLLMELACYARSRDQFFGSVQIMSRVYLFMGGGFGPAHEEILARHGVKDWRVSPFLSGVVRRLRSLAP